MNLKSISDVVSKSAPILGSVISDINPIAGVAIKLIAHIFGADSLNVDDVLEKIEKDPLAAFKLKKLELEHEELLVKYQNESYKLETDDRSNARNREIEITKLTGKTDYIVNYLAIITCSSFVSLCFLNYFFPSAENNTSATLIEQLKLGSMLVLSYYFGASNKK